MSDGAGHDESPLLMRRCAAQVHQRQMAEREADQHESELQRDPATRCD